MRRKHKATGRQNEHGAVAVETAIVLPILLLFFGLPSIFLAFYYRQYTAAQKAVHDAALYLSSAPRVEVTTTGPDGNFAALTLARKIVEKELAGIVPDEVSVAPAVFCTYRLSESMVVKPCTATLVRDINHTLFRFDVSITFTYINPLTGSDTGLLIAPSATMRYLGD